MKNKIINMISNFIRNKSRILLLIFAVIAIPFFSGCGAASQSGYLINLEIWGTFNDSMVYSEIINQYKSINPYIGEIKYRKFSPNTYRQELLDALASGQGPDIFLINNGWLPSFKNKLEPAPVQLINEQDLNNNFPDVVASDFVDEAKVYATPVSVDSLALYYNKDMFNAAGISAPPRSWLEFQEYVQKLTRINADGSFALAGAAIGTGININRSPDLLSLLMLQNGAGLPMKKGETVKIDEGVVGKDGNTVQTGEQALGFYTQFAKLSTQTGAGNPFYTWNARKNNSIDAFADGSVAMMFNYSWQAPEIKSKNSKLNFAVANVPQIDSTKPINVANYWGYAVTKNKANPVVAIGGQAPAVTITNEIRTHEAWQFLKFLTLKNSGTITLYNAVTKNKKDFPINFDPAMDYLKKTLQPAARRDIIESQKSSLNLGPFASGNLIAKHWYQADSDAVDKILIDMIESVNRGDVSFNEALSLAKNRINYLSGASTNNGL